MSDIQTWPVGLLSKLNLKATSPPRVLSDTVLGTVNLDRNYAARNIITQEFNVAGVSAVGQAAGATLTVPAGEAWDVIAVGGVLSTPSAIGTVLCGRVALFPPSGNSVTLARIESYTTTAASDVNENGLMLPQPLIVPPGFSFFTALMRPTGGATTCTVTVRVMYVPLVV